MKRVIAILTVFTCSLASLSACKDKKKDEDIDFDKGPILTNLADNYIIPAYTDLQTKVGTLHSQWNSFLADPSQVNFDATKQAWIEAVTSFHRVKLFDLGPAMSNGLAGALGTFPADTTQIKNNITSGTYNLLTAENVDAIGFDALDYLFYRNAALAEITSSTNCQTYVSDLITKMKSEVDAVVDGWNNGYRTTFIAGTSTSSTSPFALLINAFCRDFEVAKSSKLGIPIGIQSLGIQQPHYLQARRSGIGQSLLETNIQTVWDVFRGNSYTGIDGQGFDDYLNAIEKSSLTTTINSRFTYMTTHPSSWNGGIEGMMTSNPTELNSFYDYMQGTVVYLKTDMSSAFSVLITYQDNDGD